MDTRIDKAKLRKLTKALEVFKEVDPTISLPSMLALLYYADSDGIPGNRLAVEKRLGMSNATGSRATMYWSDYKAPRVPGQDYLEMQDDPLDRRQKIITLNRRGLKFLGELSEAL